MLSKNEQAKLIAAATDFALALATAKNGVDLTSEDVAMAHARAHGLHSYFDGQAIFSLGMVMLERRQHALHSFQQDFIDAFGRRPDDGDLQ